ncbi:MAG: alkaline phosphatase family protein [Rhodobacteraceae bacterium]|nr:alkaline phosphatase family protein [Paracoccaceae bacterium]
MPAPGNILFIMCDQLRFDYLGCAGHPTIRTPNIDALATQGVRFSRCYVQSPICGPSRMSTYTGRYMRSHGATWNMAPLRVGEMTMGDHLRPLGLRTVLCGKTHMTPDIEGMTRLGIDPGSERGTLIAQCGFEPWDRLDGLHPHGSKKKPQHYNETLNRRGYDGDNPWADWVAQVEGSDGTPRSGWLMAHADRPARVRAEDSETVYSTDRAMEFIDAAGEQPWCLHLSYIKPHWPYVAPAPWHAMYGADDVIAVHRDPVERQDPHPVLAAFQKHRFSEVWNRPGARERVIPTYMGLVSQIDAEVGRLVDFLHARGLDRDTLIVFTSDHGDYLGDHWLGEKELFHDRSARVPLIVVDPRPEADATRGSVCDALVEAIDLLPTFIDWAGGTPPPHIVEGRSLLAHLRDPATAPRREVVFSEYDYAYRKARRLLDRPIMDCRLVMAFDGRFKLVLAPGFRPMLWDLDDDPDEFRDIGADPAQAATVARLTAAVLDWSLRHHNRVTRSDTEVEEIGGREFHAGILIGFWDEADLAEARALGDGGN